MSNNAEARSDGNVATNDRLVFGNDEGEKADYLVLTQQGMEVCARPV